MKAFLIAMTVLGMVWSGAAGATSRALVATEKSRPSSKAAETNAVNCEVQGRFRHETHTENSKEPRVQWIYKIDSARLVGDGPCPAGAELELSIRGASFGMFPTGEAKYVYPVGIELPIAGSSSTFPIRKIKVRNTLTGESYEEWLRAEK